MILWWAWQSCSLFWLPSGGAWTGREACGSSQSLHVTAGGGRGMWVTSAEHRELLGRGGPCSAVNCLLVWLYQAVQITVLPSLPPGLSRDCEGVWAGRCCCFQPVLFAICLQQCPGQWGRTRALMLAGGTVVGKEAGEELPTCQQPHVMLS